MRNGLAVFAAAIALGCPAAHSEDRQADPPLVVNGNLSLTTRDFEAYVARLPQDKRAEFRAGIDRVRTTVDGLWVQRMLAEKARQLGLDRDPLVAARRIQAQESVLADAYLSHSDAKVTFPDLEKRALEIYRANLKDYSEPEQVHVQHILVGPNGRTPEGQIARAAELHAEALAAKGDGKKFIALAERFSDDQSVKRNSGDLGMSLASGFASGFAEAVARMKTPGEISEPVRTPYGYHIIRFVDRKPARVRPFESAKAGIIAGERQKIVDEARLKVLADVRADPGNRLHPENVDALKATIKMPDVSALSKAETTGR